MTAPPPRDVTRAQISLGALRHNLECVRSCCGRSTRLMAVVKANGYGHGILEIAREAVRGGAEALAVARVTEALEIREAGISHPVLVFENPPRALIDAALAGGIELTVSTAEAARVISGAASRRGGKAPVQVKVDTGMARLGFPADRAPSEIASLLRLPGLELAGVYSHFATSEDPDRSFADGQIALFHDVLGKLRLLGIEPPLRHMANSGAIISLPESHFDMVRPGIMLYGYAPSPSMRQRFPVIPVMTLLSSVSMMRTVAPGTGVSYGLRYRAPRRTTIATVPVGYADGYPRLLSGKASVLIGGKRYPVVGTICMDHIMADVGPNPECREGDDVTLIGRDGEETITAWDIAGTLGTIPYEITSQVSARVPRVCVP